MKRRSVYSFLSFFWLILIASCAQDMTGFDDKSASSSVTSAQREMVASSAQEIKELTLANNFWSSFNINLSDLSYWKDTVKLGDFSLIREVFQFSEDSSGKRTGEVHYFGSTNTTAPSRFFLAYFDWNLFKDPASGLFELEITYTGSNKNDSSGQPLWKGGKAVFKNLRFNQKPGMMQFECENANGKKLIYERGQ